MPWKVEKGHGCPSSKPWAVLKESDGSVVACHVSEQKAKKQLAALYASENKSFNTEDAMTLEILPHPSKADQRIFPVSIHTRAAANAGDRPVITVTGTDGTEDRHGSVISPDGWDLVPFNRNPVVTWSHQDDIIPAIGRAPNPRHVGGEWDFDIEFAIEQWREFGDGNLAALVYRLMKDDYLRAVSVSFIPKKWEDREASTIPSFFAENLRYLKQELTAISPCNVGSNRNGLKKAVGDRVISENEATLLGLGSMLKVEMTIPIVGRKKPEEKPKVKDKNKPTAAEMVRTLREIAKRCGCYDDCSMAAEEEPLTAEESAAEIATINALAAEQLDIIGVAVAGWQSAEHDELRGFCANAVYGAMWQFDTLAQWLERWFGQEIDGGAPDVSTTDISMVVTAANPDKWKRVGAVLNGSNKTKLQQIASLAGEVLASAEKELEKVEATAPKNTIRVISGDSPAGSGAKLSQPFRIAASDAAGAGARGESNPNDQNNPLKLILNQK